MMQYITDSLISQPAIGAGILFLAVLLIVGITYLARQTKAYLNHRYIIHLNGTRKLEQEDLTNRVANKVALYVQEREIRDREFYQQKEVESLLVEEVDYNQFPVIHRAIIMKGEKQKGAVLIVTLIILTMVTLLGVAGMQASTMQVRMSKNYQDGNDAFQWAESGLADAKWQLVGDFDAVKDAYIANGDVYTGTRTEGHTTYDFEFLQYRDEAALGSGLEGFSVRSVGTTTTGARRVVNSVFIHSDVPVNINSALSLHPAGAVTLKGNSTISGLNHDVPTDFDCNGSGCAGSLNGTGDATGIYSEAGGGTLNQIGSPTLAGAPATQTGGGAYDEAYWTAYANNVSAFATSTNGADSSGTVNWGTRTDPIIHVIDQPMMINSNLDGAGILIISADVVVNGNFHFEGLVLVVSPGAVNFTVGGTARIFGATVAASPSATIDVGATGTPGVLFSLAALGNLNNINSVRRTAWSQEM